MSEVVSQEGYIPVTGGRVWYRIVGAGTGIPLLTLHGGPGANSAYLESLSALADERPVVFYDQLGAESPITQTTQLCGRWSALSKSWYKCVLRSSSHEFISTVRHGARCLQWRTHSHSLSPSQPDSLRALAEHPTLSPGCGWPQA